MCDALLYCRTEFLYLSSYGGTESYVHPPEFNQLSIVTLAIYNHRKGLDAKAQKADKTESESALRETAKASQREVSRIQAFQLAMLKLLTS